MKKATTPKGTIIPTPQSDLLNQKTPIGKNPSAVDDLARLIARHAATRYPAPVDADTFRAVHPLPPVNHPNNIGTAWRKAAALGFIVKAGHRNARRRKSHGAEFNRWTWTGKSVPPLEAGA